MNDDKIRTQIHNAVDQYCAKYEVKDDPYLAQRVLNTSHASPMKGGIVVKKKLTIGFVIMLAVLLSVTALAAVLLSPKEVVEQVAVPIAQKNEQPNYTFEELTELLLTLNENGITLDEGSRMMQAFSTGHGYWEKDTIREICLAAFGSDERTWSIEQRHWYGETMVSVGAWDKNIWLIPGEDDLDIAEARLRGAQALKAAYDIDFPIENDETWFIYETYELMWDAVTNEFLAENAQWTFVYVNQKTGESYTVILARDGHVIDISDDRDKKFETSDAVSSLSTPYPKEEQAIMQYGSIMHFWPHEVQVDVYGEPYAIPSQQEYNSALVIAKEAIRVKFGEDALKTLGAYKVGYLHTAFVDDENQAMQLHWDFMISTDTEYLSDGYRVQFYQIIDCSTDSEEIIDMIVEYANMGNG